MPSDGKSSHGLWPGELIMMINTVLTFFHILRLNTIIANVKLTYPVMAI
jgi:hypothetical protein